MRKAAVLFLSFAAILSTFVRSSHACTTFCLKNNGEVLFGKNYDWMIGDGMLFVNKRGVSKSAAGDGIGGGNLARWTSKYGSVTFNQYGRENPSGGMNEAGLVIELMWLDETQWPKPDSRPAIGTLEWIQYQLDNSATVDEVIRNADAVRIQSDVKIHYLVNDKAGNSAAVEFLDGKLVAHTGEKLAVAALANDTYEKSLKYSASASSPASQSSLDRFARAAAMAKEFESAPKTEAVKYAFDVLANVSQKGYTQWSIVYDQKRGKIHFRSLQSPAVKTVEFANFDYSCGSTVKVFDVNSALSGDVTSRFADYTRLANRDLIERAFSGTPFLKGVPAVVKDLAAGLPETFGCGTRTSPASVKKHEITAHIYLPFPLNYFYEWLVA